MSENATTERFIERLMEHLLRYAIEHLDKKERKQYMDMKRAVDRP